MMVFNENYGELPKSLLSLIRRHNVSPADYDILEFSGMSFSDMEAHIKSNLRDGMYVMPWPLEV